MPVNDLALLRRRRALTDQLRTITSSRLARLWTSLDNYTDDDQWITLAEPVVTAAQDRSASLQLAYLESKLGRFGFDMDTILRRAGVDLSSPFTALANALDKGAEFTDALQAGQARAEGVGESGVTWAARAANEQADGHERIVGWTRVLSGGACDWCQLVSTQRYHTAESASFGHLRCNCDVDPILGDRDPGQVINHELLAELKS